MSRLRQCLRGVIALAYVLLRVLCPLLLFLLGVFPFVLRFGGPKCAAWVETQLAALPSWAAVAWWALLAVLPLCLVVLYFLRLCRVDVLVLRTGSDQPLKIRESAVNRYVHDRLLALSFVKSASVMARSRGGALALRVRVWVACRKPLSNIQERIITRIVDDARQAFGVSRILPPDVLFESVKAAKTPSPEESEEESPTPYEPSAPYESSVETKPVADTDSDAIAAEPAADTEQK